MRAILRLLLLISGISLRTLAARPPARVVTPIASRVDQRNDKKRVLVLMSDTGGGHRASAVALDQALNEIYPRKMDVKICDIWTENAGWPFNRFVPSYRLIMLILTYKHH